MSCYISSNENRLYAAIEAEYGQTPAMAGGDRIPAVRFQPRQNVHVPQRRDKTGTRSNPGVPAGRRETAYQLHVYLTAWLNQARQPACGALVRAALGGEVQTHAGGTIAEAPSATRLRFAAPHSLSSGQAVAMAGDLRFVAAVVDATTVEVNAPFSAPVQAGAQAGATVTYRCGGSVPSFSVLDCWTPAEAVQRLMSGGTVEEFQLNVNGDYHEFGFAGPARDIGDSITSADSDGAAITLPAEPADETGTMDVIPGHLGQVWLGPSLRQFHTLTEARLRLRNNLEMRAREFGSRVPCGVAAGRRDVLLDFELLASDEEKSHELYVASRQRSPIQVMLQLGQKPHQLFGAYMKSVVAEQPDFDDAEARLTWRFRDCRALGTSDDELVVAFA